MPASMFLVQRVCAEIKTVAGIHVIQHETTVTFHENKMWPLTACVVRCRALAMLAQVHRVSGFARARVSERAGDGAVLQAIADLTRACISAGGMSEEAEGTWTAEATDLLLDTWVELLYERAVCSTR